MDVFVFLIGVLFLCYILIRLGFVIYDALQWAFFDTIRAWKYREPEANTMKVIKALFVIFVTEFKDSVIRSFRGIKRVA